MPSDTGYDLALYPNLARYRTPQKDINSSGLTYKPYNATDANNSNNNGSSSTYLYTAYSNRPASPLYQTRGFRQGEEEEDGEEEEEPSQQPSTPKSPPYQPQAQREEQREQKQKQNPTPSSPTYTSTTTTARTRPPLPTVSVPLCAADILLHGETECRRCPLCFSKVCLLRGACVADSGRGRRVKFVFW